VKSWKKIILVGCTLLPSTLRLLVWRALGFKVGSRCRVSIFSLVVADHIEIGHGAVIEAFVLIYCPKKLEMGERSRIASFVRIVGFGAAILCDRTFIGLGNLIDVTDEFYLGESSQMGPRGIYYTHGSTGLLYNVEFPHKVAPIRIEANCWMGMNCSVYPGVRIGARTIVYPGVVVNRDVPEGSAVRPVEPHYEIIPIEKLQKRVDVDEKLRTMKGVLQQLHEAWPGTTLDTGDAACWKLFVPREGAVYLCTDGAAALPARGGNRVLVWQLSGAPRETGSPTFIFDRLTVAGEWTLFADKVAQFLCEEAGTHFTFEQRKRGSFHEKRTPTLDTNLG